MMDLNFLADDGLVDALLIEVSGLLKTLIARGQTGSIDLMGLPLSASCLAALEQLLGDGEVTAVLNAAGQSQFRETAFPGVWWTSHSDEAGRVVAMLIEVAVVPAILQADSNDMTLGLERLLQTTNFSMARSKL